MSRTIRFRRSYSKKKESFYNYCEKIKKDLYVVIDVGEVGKKVKKITKKEKFLHFDSHKQDGNNDLYGSMKKKFFRKDMERKLRTYNKKEMKKAMDFNYDALLLEILPKDYID